MPIEEQIPLMSLSVDVIDISLRQAAHGLPPQVMNQSSTSLQFATDLLRLKLRQRRAQLFISPVRLLLY